MYQRTIGALENESLLKKPTREEKKETRDRQRKVKISHIFITHLTVVKVRVRVAEEERGQGAPQMFRKRIEMFSGLGSHQFRDNRGHA
jgi:hypothetical protein